MRADADNWSHSSKPLVLVVEDGAALVAELRHKLEKHGFQVEEAGGGDEALARIDEASPDLVLIDWMLPVVSGIEVCRQLRRHDATRDVPIIVVNARTSPQDLVLALDTGADDYVTKPIGMDGLVARMRALLRRAGTKRRKRRLTFYEVTMDLVSHRVLRNGRPLHLGPTEFRLLHFLLEHPSSVFSRKELRDAVWSSDTDIGLRAVDVSIRRLRQSMNALGERDLVSTIRSTGYALVSQ